MRKCRVFGLIWLIFMLPVLLGQAVPAGYGLRWSDEFTNNALDTGNWSYVQTGWRNSAYNTPSAVSVTNGCLVITTYTQGGTNFTGFIDTSGKVTNSYGYYEASIEFSNAPGNWSAFWLQSPFVGNTNSNPTNGVEIDIFEHRETDGSVSWVNGGDSAIHWNGYGSAEQSGSWSSTSIGVGSGFHTYGLWWVTNSYTFYVDGVAHWTTNHLISSAPEFIRLTSEVRSNNWAGNVPAGSYPGLAASPYKMLVDYVRYYAPLVTPVLNGPLHRAAGTNFFSFSGVSGQSYRVLASTNLLLPVTNWLVLTNGTFGAGLVNYTDNAALTGPEFYRVTSP